MAHRGATWTQILSHYYTGMSLWTPRGVVTPVLAESVVGRGWTIEVAPWSDSGMIVGCMPLKGVAITIADEWGNRVQTVSGAELQHGGGGFRVLTWGKGRYTISLLDAVFQFDVGEQGVLLTFRSQQSDVSSQASDRFCSSSGRRESRAAAESQSPSTRSNACRTRLSSSAATVASKSSPSFGRR